MKNIIFREYDIRGIVGKELIVDEVYDLARAMAFFLVEKNPLCKTVAVGMDGRVTSQEIKEHVCRGLNASGLDVIFIGLCTTPMIYFATHTLSVDAAIMVTASHNPPEYNGFKILLGTTSLWGEQIKEIGRLYATKSSIEASLLGTYKEHSIADMYIDWHVTTFEHLKNNDLSMVIDCANGAAGVVIPDIVKQMGWKNAQLLFTEVDGRFPNHEADPTVAKNMVVMRDKIVSSGATLGIGFDGDADRMAAMTHSGELVPGDKLLALFAQSMIKENPGMTVVYNVVCSAGLTELLEKWGAHSVMAPVGHSLIEESMHENHALLGGETSCHFFFRDRNFFGYDDGIYAMFRLIEIIVDSGKSLEELLKVFPHKVTSPEYRVPCEEDKKYEVIEGVKNILMKQKHMQVITLDGVRVETDYGWGIVRASNTQPVLSMRFEANTEEDLKKIKQEFVTALRNYFDEGFLRKQLEM